MSYQWRSIEDLPDDWQRLSSVELQDLAAIWKERADQLKDSEARKRFNERLSREWAIETGILERVYSIDRGITLMLIERGIEASLIPHDATDKPAEVVVAIVRDHQDALEGLFEFIAQRRDLTTSYINQLHQALTRHQETVAGVTSAGVATEMPLLRGKWKMQPNNPSRANGSVHEYCPPVHVAREMERIVELHSEHNRQSVPPEVEAAWLHHRFTQIHPFMDGNGRVARALSSLVFLRAGWFPLVVRRDQRDEYLDALLAADYGDLSRLAALFSRIETREFNSALSVAEDVARDADPIQREITAAAERQRERKATRLQEQTAVFQISRTLEQLALTRLSDIAGSLSSELSDTSVSADCSSDETDFWFKAQIIAAAKQLGYYADTRSYRAWVRLRIREDRDAHVVLSFHSLGVQFLGIMAVSAFLEYRDRDGEGTITSQEPRIICTTAFQFSYKEHEDIVVTRFRDWLNDVIIIGLEEWRKQL